MKQEDALAALADLSPAEVLRLHSIERGKKLRAEEDAKKHPLKSFSLSKTEWEDFRAHVLDGGGVLDDTDVRRELHQALFSDDQAAFWPLLVHWLKSKLKTGGNITPLPNGGVTHSGVGL